ncbi:MAG: ABC transporter ATP-binding protein [Pseudomonadota bacterium]
MSAPGPQSLIAAGLKKRLGGRLIVDDVDLEIRPNRVTALLGASGAGKSTVLRLLAGLERVDAGTVAIGGALLSRRGYTRPPEARRTGLIFQDFALFPHLTAAENVAFGLAHLGRSARVAKAQDWLERLELSHRADAYPQALSGGEQQRVAIARALAPGPDALLMDEPFAGLDPALREGVADLALSAVAQTGIPTLLVSHDAQSAMERADTLAVMRAGRILQTGTPEEIYDRPVSLEVAEALGPVVTFALGEVPSGLWPGNAPRGLADPVLAARASAFRRVEAAGCRVRVERIARMADGVSATVVHAAAAFKVRLPLEHSPQPGDEIRLELGRRGVFVFAKG